MRKKTAATAAALPPKTHTVAIGVGDLNGILRGKRAAAAQMPHIRKNGAAFCASMFAMDMTCEVWETPYVNFDNGFPDCFVRPLAGGLGKPVAVPWEAGVAFCFGEAQDERGKPLPIDPRQALVRAEAAARAMGYEARIGAELEFFLLDAQTLQPRDEGIQVYGLTRAAEMEEVLGPIRRQMEALGIPIEQSNPEYAAGQAEVNFRFGGALETADRVVMFRAFVKELAQKRGYRATFMAKPFLESSGNGLHANHSLWKNGKNVFDGGASLSPIGLQYLAGMQKRMAESALAALTTPNAYRRLQVNSFCPINNTWGYDNRTTGLRALVGKSAARVEHRVAAADCNPYLFFAAGILAGLEGMQAKLKPTPATTGNGYKAKNAVALPRNLTEATRLAGKSAFMREAYGGQMLQLAMQQAEREVAFFDRQITEVEKRRYLKNM